MLFSQSNPSSRMTSGYIKKDGSYIAPSYKTSPNYTQRDNYSAKGNYNPYTGKSGTKQPKK